MSERSEPQAGFSRPGVSEVSSRKIDVTHVSYSADFLKAGIAPNFGHFVFYSADFFKVRFAPFFGHFVFIYSADFFKARFAPFFGHFVFILSADFFKAP